MLLAHQFFPDDYAGTEVLTLGIAKELRARGHDARVFAAKRSVTGGIRPGESEDYEHEGVPVRRIGRPEEGFSRPFRLNYENPVMAEKAGEYAREFRPDVVHVMHLQGLTVSVLEAFVEVGTPIVYTATDFWAVCPVVDLMRHDGVLCRGPEVSHCIRCVASRSPGSRMKEVLDRTPTPVLKAAGALSRAPISGLAHSLRQVRDLSQRAEYIREKMKLVDRIIAPTRLTRDLLLENGVGEGRIEVSHYGIDTRSGPENRLREPSTGLRIGFIGTLGSHKGCDLLIRAFKSLPETLEVSLTIHGDLGRYESYGKELLALAGDDGRITFPGTFPPDEIARVFSELDVLVVPSRWYENTPLVIYEAFASKTPVLATDLGGLSEVVKDGENGLLFGLDDAKDLSRCLRRLAEEPGLLDELRAGIGLVKTVSESVDELEELYRGLMSRKASV